MLVHDARISSEFQQRLGEREIAVLGSDVEGSVPGFAAGYVTSAEGIDVEAG
jgi:hypothetical protein